MQTLYVKDTPEVNALITRLGFKTDTQGLYKLDEPLFDYMEIAEEPLESYRPVAVHIVPYTLIDNKRFYYAFQAEKGATVYVSFTITPDDFVQASDTDPYMSLCRSVVGKIISVLDQEHIDLKIDMSTFLFPAVIDGEFVWAMEVKGDNNVVVDELVAQLGTVIGRVAHSELTDDTEGFNALSAAIVNYKEQTNETPEHNLSV